MTKTRLIALSIILLGLVAYGAGVSTSPLLRGLDPRPPALDQEFAIFWEAWNLVDERFVDRQALETKERVYGAIQGQLDALGDIGHTRFLSPEDLKEQREGLAGRFQGIGAEISARDGRPTIVTPLDDSPAERAGIQAGDVIVAIDGEDIGHLTLQEVIRRIRGEKGTAVTLSVIHPGQTEVVDLRIVRDDINVLSVSAKFLPQSAVGHVRIAQFAEHTGQELLAALRSLRDQGAKALVVDVRNNPGGLLDQAVTVTSQFLAEGNVLLEQDAKGQRRAYPAQTGGLATEIPMAVLINRGSASAAEIFSGAIKDNKRGALIGERTFGTGTVLSTFGLSDGSALLLATSEWLTPNGQIIRANGIEPDLAVSLSNGRLPSTPRQAQGMSEDEILSGDAQLRAAVSALVGAQQQGTALAAP